MQSNEPSTPRGSVAHQEHDELGGEARGGRSRRDCSMPASEKTTWRGRWEARQLDSSRTVTMSRTAVPTVGTARPGASPIDGDSRGPSALGFRFGKELGEERGIGGSLRLL
jgi:hypothetical protein